MSSAASLATSVTHWPTTEGLPYQGRPIEDPSAAGRTAPSGLWYTPSNVSCLAPVSGTSVAIGRVFG